MSTRKMLARAVRRVMSARHTPYWAERLLRRLAHAIMPHSLRCRHCGEEFIAPEWWSRRHATLAYEHYLAVHESPVVEGGTLVRTWLGWGAGCADCSWRTDGNDYAAQSLAARLLTQHRKKHHPVPGIQQGGKP